MSTNLRDSTLAKAALAAACPTVSDEKRQGTEPGRDELFEINGGERDFQLLKEGFRGFGKSNYFSDEDLIAAVATVGLRTGRPTTIFTREGDLLEQFQKMTSLLTMHYQGLLFAEITLDWNQD